MKLVPIEDQVRQDIRLFVSGAMSLDDLLQRFVPLSLDIEQSGDDALIALVYQIDGILAEASSANWCEFDIRLALMNATVPFRRATKNDRCGSTMSEQL